MEIKVEAEEFVLVWRGQGTVVVEAEKGRQVVPDAAKRPNISIGISLPKKERKRRQLCQIFEAAIHFHFIFPNSAII